MQKEIEEVLELLDSAEEFRPLVRKGLDVLFSFGPELSELLTTASNWVTTRKIADVQAFIDAGFSRQEAMYLTMDKWYAMKGLVSLSGKGKGKG